MITPVLHAILQAARHDATFAPGIYERRAAMEVVGRIDALEGALENQALARQRDEADASRYAERDATISGLFAAAAPADTWAGAEGEV